MEEAHLSAPLAIAIVCPTAWPPGDDIAWRVHEEADALARRGHRVTIFAPAARAGGRRARTIAGPSSTSTEDDPQQVRVQIIGTARRTGSRLGVAPFDASSQLAHHISNDGFDVVHVHEPLTPSPGLSALRHASGVTAMTFHRPDPITGAAFLGSLVHRALERVDIRIATSPTVERAVSQILGGTYLVHPWGTRSEPATVPRNGIALIARGRDRTGLRFILGVVRQLSGLEGVPITLMGPREAPWRTMTAIPKALRDHVTVIADTGPESWHQLLANASIVLCATPEELEGPVAAQARVGLRTVIAPGRSDADDPLHTMDGVIIVPPFLRDAWVTAIGDRAREMSSPAIPHTPATTWDDIAGELETAYRDALVHHSDGPAPEDARIIADLRLRPAPGIDPQQFATACWESGLDVIAVTSAHGVSVANSIAAHAPNGLSVICGQEIVSADGVIAALFVSRDVAHGLSFAATAHQIHAQGGLVVIPHPAGVEIPSSNILRQHAALIDCYELIGPASGPGQRHTLRTTRRLGMTVSAGSGASDGEGLGHIGIAMRPFRDRMDFLDALHDGEIVRPHRRRTRRTRAPRATS